jgi:hypothetical protein
MDLKKINSFLLNYNLIFTIYYLLFSIKEITFNFYLRAF